MSGLVSVFTECGLKAFEDFLIEARFDPSQEVARDLIFGAANATPVKGAVSFGRVEGSQRLHAAQYVDAILDRSGDRLQLESSVEFWSWLVAANFKQLCPKHDKTRCFRIGTDLSYWIPRLRDYRRRQRHRLSGPYFTYRAHFSEPRRAMGYLGSRINAYEDLNDRFLGKEQFATATSVAQVVTDLYYASSTSSMKKGSSGSSPGCPRRLADILGQFALTYDLGALSGAQLLAMLPTEFDRFRQP